MTISILLRLRADGLANRQLAGHAEVVDTGQTGTFGHVVDLIAFLEASIAYAVEGMPRGTDQPIAQSDDMERAD